MDVPFTPEQIEWLESNYGRKTRNSEDIREFRADVARWVETKHTANVSKNTIQNGLYGALRMRLNIKSMNALTDEMLPEARQAFEKYKEDFDV